MPWTQEDLTEFCNKPLLAVLSTVSPGGRPQATVVWYEYDGENFLITAFPDRAKTRNIRHQQRVCLCVPDPDDHDRPLMVSGRAYIIEEGAEEATYRQARRYFEEEEARRRATGLTVRERVIIKIVPEKFLGAEG